MALNLVATGAYFGVLQWCAFFRLQSSLAATAMVYLLATAAWMLGSLVGLTLPGRSREGGWLAASVVSYAILDGVAQGHPYDLAWLPVCLSAVVVMGGYAGRFFRFRAGSVGESRSLFFLENTGFVLGMGFTVLGLHLGGDVFLRWLPWIAAAACVVTGAAVPRVPPSGLPLGEDASPSPCGGAVR
ncbi:MAG: hypothetical protein IT580_11900 [Verrucomicrobiales bacterium]|nr:hypothetical protein [Verrucomicrobiales bacterium]